MHTLTKRPNDVADSGRRPVREIRAKHPYWSSFGVRAWRTEVERSPQGQQIEDQMDPPISRAIEGFVHGLVVETPDLSSSEYRTFIIAFHFTAARALYDEVISIPAGIVGAVVEVTQDSSLGLEPNKHGP